ncbi:hypothetical protein PPS11_02933 [Pseudomonas putida S11]|nr:hypothetical protein PPS11_02933 [Pseudomonas putida S11]
MENTIQQLIDREAIRDLRTLYAHHLDSNNIQALDEVFSADAVVEVTVGKMEGIEAIKSGVCKRPLHSTIGIIEAAFRSCTQSPIIGSS